MSEDAVPEIADIEKLTQLPVEQLVALLVQQQRVIELLQQEIERLKVSAATDSQTSSKPPSTDLLKKPTQKKPTPEPTTDQKPKRLPGGQPGHAGKTRKGFGRVDRYEIQKPQVCSHCGSTDWVSQPVSISCQQVAQLVERPIEVVEYQRHSCRCRSCGQTTIADWPTEVIHQDLDANLQAFLGWLGNYGHLPYEKQAELLWELGGIEVGIGTLAATNSRVAQTLTTAVSELKQWVQQQPHVHVDETPWVVKGIKEWLWVAANKLFCVFHAGDTRSRAELESLLGKSFSGVISSDDLSVYNGYPVAGQQKCLAHLRRHVQKLIKFGHSVQVTIGEEVLQLIDEAFQQYRCWQETKDRQSYQEWVTGFQLRLEQTVKQLRPLAGYQAGKILRSLTNKSQQWWYFLEHPEVPPDNNLAERALRLAVTKRKVSGGSRSMERFAETAILLSAAQTCRFQGRSVMQFLRAALMAFAHQVLPFPSLIPATPT
ncbi:IS66 family transposase [Microseira wollei]|uniref:Transposase IS66 n=1 Tax=Microseira wollei NIES-4236 TaxID=2530354 RepID=A0AAV3XPT2_9CYAN|nr:IS66 family transposase [Microseira wollei]GET44569.1 transposase IS66 [Microseira wollei NIES-4236]